MQIQRISNSSKPNYYKIKQKHVSREVIKPRAESEVQKSRTSLSVEKCSTQLTHSYRKMLTVTEHQYYLLTSSRNKKENKKAKLTF